MYPPYYIHIHVRNYEHSLIEVDIMISPVHTYYVQLFGLQFYLRSWSQELQCPVVSIDYSLCPDAPFPRPLEECTMAYAWILQNLALLGLHYTLCVPPPCPFIHPHISSYVVYIFTSEYYAFTSVCVCEYVHVRMEVYMYVVWYIYNGGPRQHCRCV